MNYGPEYIISLERLVFEAQADTPACNVGVWWMWAIVDEVGQRVHTGPKAMKTPESALLEARKYLTAEGMQI